MVPLPVPLSLPTAIICSGLRHKDSNNEPIDLLLPSKSPTPYHSLPPRLRTFAHKPTQEPPHVCTPSSTKPRTNCLASAHLCPEFSALLPTLLRTNAPIVARPRLLTHAGATPHLGTFVSKSTQTQFHRRVLSYSFTPIFAHFSAEKPPYSCAPSLLFPHTLRYFLPRKRSIVPYIQIVTPMPCECLCGGIGKKSIGYPRKVYRVFPESL